MENNRTDLQDLSQQSQHGSADASSKKGSNCCARAPAAQRSGTEVAGGWRWRPICSPSRLAALPLVPPADSPSAAQLPSAAPLPRMQFFGFSTGGVGVWERLRQTGTSCQVKSGLRLLVSADRIGSPTISRRCCSAAGEPDGFSFPPTSSNTSSLGEYLTLCSGCCCPDLLLGERRFTLLRRKCSSAILHLRVTRQVIVPARLIKGSDG